MIFIYHFKHFILTCVNVSLFLSPSLSQRGIYRLFIFYAVACNNKAICVSGVLMFAVRKIDGKF